MRIQDLPTPALLLDADVFASNIGLMAEHAARAGKKLRPHAKAHKCVAIARRQVDASAVGVCVATVPEAELMVRAGIPGVLLTSPIADPAKCLRMAVLAVMANDTAVVVDHLQQAQMYSDAAGRVGVKLNVLVDIDLGDHRTGIAPGDPALQLAEAIRKYRNLSFAGLQAYSVRASHIEDEEARAKYSADVLDNVLLTCRLLDAQGIGVPLVTGGSTGSYRCDAALPYMTELQAGSYALMDVAYGRLGGVAFGHALTVLATVVSANHADRVTVDAGFKAFATDRPFGPEIQDGDGARYEWGGDEFGYVFPGSRPRLQLGDRVRFIPPHCDPTVNLYDRIHVCRGDEVEDVWPVMGE
ncbi:MAG TPA: DSD1 family PLP-dependent enzyme [Bryobacteraceae bacterium]|nr:DSD1 family PLP-dependent enzyme [Bryobacteraceae bacterium]